MIPLELLSMLSSTLIGGILSIMAQKSQAEAEKQKMLMQRAEFAAQQVDKAREVTDQFTKNTRSRRLVFFREERKNRRFNSFNGRNVILSRGRIYIFFW